MIIIMIIITLINIILIIIISISITTSDAIKTLPLSLLVLHLQIIAVTIETIITVSTYCRNINIYINSCSSDLSKEKIRNMHFLAAGFQRLNCLKNIRQWVNTSIWDYSIPQCLAVDWSPVQYSSEGLLSAAKLWMEHDKWGSCWLGICSENYFYMVRWLKDT